MSWQPPARPDWVVAIERAEAGPLAEEAALPLAREALVGEAAARQGRGATASEIDRAFGRSGFEAGPAFANLDLLLAALDDEASLTRIGRVLARRFLLRLLEVRLQLLAYLDRDPGVLEEQIRAPLVVAGAPRTGTTTLHALLAADPRHRAPLGWELLRPVPPPSGDADERRRDPRIALAERELVGPQTVVSGLRAIHEYGAARPKECLSAMSFAFQSEEFSARYRVPGFERWLVDADPTPAYRMHRLVLQVLQRRSGRAAWVLKSPVHLHALPTLFETYPDARVLVTHRDPAVALASLASLIATLRWAHSDRVDAGEIARGQLERFRRSFEKLVEWTDDGTLPVERMHHSHFADLERDPFAVVAALYERFGIALTPAAEAGLRDAARAAGAGAQHGYPRDIAGDPESLRRAFARYRTRFGVPES